MEGTDKKAPPRRARTTKAPSAPVPANDQGDVPLAALAAGVLSREIRPRQADIRRLAEAVLAAAAPPAGKKAKGPEKKKKKDKEAVAAKKTADKKPKKLAKIPGQKAKK